MATVNFTCKSFSELTTVDLYAILNLRSAVFVVEQNCVYQDIDNKDQKAYHILGYRNTELVAYTRIFNAGDYAKHSSIGRVVVKESARQLGLGKLLMNATIKELYSLFGEETIEISAQLYLKKFYEDLGFQQEGEGYLEDGIPHIKMLKYT